MSMHVVRSTAAVVHMDAATPIDVLIDDAVAACANVHAAAIALHEPAEHRLRAIREAGRLLSLVQRSDGGRPLNNSSWALTSYQLALTQAGITRQTASAWRRVAVIPEQDFEQFIADAKLSTADLTIARLLRAYGPTSELGSVGHTVKLKLSEAEYREFQQHVGVLGAVYFTDTGTQTVLAVLRHAHSGWLAAQAARAYESGDGTALTAHLVDA
jgi:hypothetical protein